MIIQQFICIIELYKNQSNTGNLLLYYVPGTIIYLHLISYKNSSDPCQLYESVQ